MQPIDATHLPVVLEDTQPPVLTLITASCQSASNRLRWLGSIDGSNSRSACQRAAMSSIEAEYPDLQAGEVGRAQRGRLGLLRPFDDDAEHVGEKSGTTSCSAPCRHRRVTGLASGRRGVSPRAGRRSGKQTDSSVARTSSAGPVSRVMPKMAPRASGSQCGAPSPVKAGTM